MGHFRLVLSFAEMLHHVLLVFEEVTFSQSPSRAGLSLARVTPINLMQERVSAWPWQMSAFYTAFFIRLDSEYHLCHPNTAKAGAAAVFQQLEDRNTPRRKAAETSPAHCTLV